MLLLISVYWHTLVMIQDDSRWNSNQITCQSVENDVYPSWFVCKQVSAWTSLKCLYIIFPCLDKINQYTDVKTPQEKGNIFWNQPSEDGLAGNYNRIHYMLSQCSFALQTFLVPWFTYLNSIWSYAQHEINLGFPKIGANNRKWLKMLKTKVNPFFKLGGAI